MRLVSLCPSTTESLVDLGMAEHLVGITRFCIHPESVVSGIPKVGGTKDPKLGAIAELEPDLIFMNEEENRREDYEALSSRFEVDVSFPRGPADVPPLLLRWGERIGAKRPAEAWAAAIRGELEKPPVSPEQSYVYLIWRRPFMAAGPGTYVDQLLAAVGARNGVTGLQPYPEVDLATVPGDLTLLADEPFPFGPKHLEEIVALRPRSKPLFVSGDDLSWHGTRTVRGLRLARAIASGACSPGRTRWSADRIQS